MLYRVSHSQNNFQNFQKNICEGAQQTFLHQLWRHTRNCRFNKRRGDERKHSPVKIPPVLFSKLFKVSNLKANCVFDGHAYHRYESRRESRLEKVFRFGRLLWPVHAFRADYCATGAKSCETFDRLKVSHYVWEN